MRSTGLMACVGTILIGLLSVGAMAGEWPIAATAETVSPLGRGDVSDDPAIWLHPSDPARSVILGTNKSSDRNGGLYVHRLDGARVDGGDQWVEGRNWFRSDDDTNSKYNNCDVRYGFAAGRARRQARELLERVGLGHRLGHKPGKLSGGEKQRVAIACALMGEPEVLLADEPTGNLDAATAREIEDLLFDLAAERELAMVLVTHERALAERCSRALALEDGRLTETGASGTATG